MNKRTAELIKYGEQCGFRSVGVVGNGHIELRHPNGEVVHVASTPGELRGDDNARAEMRRKSGVTPPRPNSGKHRRGVSRARFVPASELVESDSAKYARFEYKHRALCMEIDAARERGDVVEGRRLVYDLLATEAQIERLGRPVPLRTFRVSQ